MKKTMLILILALVSLVSCRKEKCEEMIENQPHNIRFECPYLPDMFDVYDDYFTFSVNGVVKSPLTTYSLNKNDVAKVVKVQAFPSDFDNIPIGIIYQDGDTIATLLGSGTQLIYTVN